MKLLQLFFPNTASQGPKRATIRRVYLCWKIGKFARAHFTGPTLDEAEDKLTEWALSQWPLNVDLHVTYEIRFSNGLAFDDEIICDHWGTTAAAQTLREHFRDAVLFQMCEPNLWLKHGRGNLAALCGIDHAKRRAAQLIFQECELPEIWG